MDNSSKRIAWIDTLKFIGIFGVYICHFQAEAGYFYTFGFRFLAELFIFVSGAMEAISTIELSLFDNIKRKFQSIILPYFFFCFISILIIIFSGEATVNVLLKTSFQYLTGVRNTLFSPILWFLPTLFVISVIFILLKKLIKNRWLILLAGAILFIIAETLLPHHPLVEPSWYWNVDSAIYFFFYYALGYALFPYIAQLLSSNSRITRLAVLISGVFAGAYALAFLLGKDYIAIFLGQVPHSNPIISISSAIVLIWFSIFVSQTISSIELFQRIGRNTLYILGSEQIIKHLTPTLFSIFGLNLKIESLSGVIIFTFLAFVAEIYLIVPFLKTFYKGILSFVIGPGRTQEKSQIG